MSEELQELLQAARSRHIPAEEQDKQRRSFAYGNAHFENERITRKTVDDAAEALKADRTTD